MEWQDFCAEIVHIALYHMRNSNNLWDWNLCQHSLWNKKTGPMVLERRNKAKGA